LRLHGRHSAPRPRKRCLSIVGRSSVSDSMVPPFPGHQVATLAARPAVDSATATAVPLLRSIYWARKHSLQIVQPMPRVLAPWAVPAHNVRGDRAEPEGRPRSATSHPQMDASPFSDAEQGTQMIVLFVLASFVAVTCGLRFRWLAKQFVLARQAVRK
jgi:hypothetical protein